RKAGGSPPTDRTCTVDSLACYPPAIPPLEEARYPPPESHRRFVMDRMSPLDASFLHIENDSNHMHIGSVAILEGPAPDYGDFADLVASKLPQVPRYRQKVRFVPFNIGRPVWVDHPHFNIGYHLRHTALPPPGADRELRNIVGRLMAQQLDRTKPLWEMWMVEGLQDGHWAIVSKVHHCMVDGVSGSDLLAVMLDGER